MISRSNVISSKTSNQHVVEDYHFKVITEFAEPEKHNSQNDTEKENKENHPTPKTPNPANNEIQLEEKTSPEPLFQPSFVEDLLKKTDEMSNNIIKLQMQIESQESEFNNRLNSELENAKEKFTKEGYEKAKAEFDKELIDLKDKYLKSVMKLDEACQNLDSFVEKNEKDLADTAIDIAKEVILKELNEDSKKIAYALAKDLISELKGASAIELKVNSNDFDYLKEKFSDNAHIKINLDDAISKGSVVVLSDAGNIESNLNNRLTKIKKMVNNE
ncbi:flagellar assembly protein FliH [Campylobacter cuniculorum]|uniref:Flagellar assembly protein FliH n=2 Tax=Campylobacter cuniculorum TaxID=374106 RepID=A0A1W6BZ78_9BACT|nr:flagellar assembly protein FliH [Campylobacter cuniculorum]ARJ57365.1 flagellar export apparatus, flagellar assembly protein FliH [Campylobacter cuniculorum DSM 23162 = LMG 24588]QOR04801.1 flagellar assembly protein FliH [Campylobacter cuniculorum]